MTTPDPPPAGPRADGPQGDDPSPTGPPPGGGGEHDDPPRDDPPPDDAAPAPRFRGLLYLGIASSGVCLAAALLVYLLYLGDKGNTIAGPVSLFVAVVALIVTVVIKLIDDRRIELSMPPALRRPAQVLGVVVMTAAVVASVVLIRVAVVQRQIPITDALGIRNGAGLANGDVASVVIPGPDRRTWIAITPLMRSVDPQLGNCEGSSTYQVTLLVDGAQKQVEYGAAPGHELRLPLGEAASAATLQFSPRIPYDPSCRVDLSIAQAFLFTEDDR